jgi:hypothetical protein
LAYIKQLNNKHLPKNLYIHVLYMYFVDDELNSLIRAKQQIKQLMKVNIQETERVNRQTTQSVDTVLTDTTNSNGTIKDAITGLRTCSQIVFESINMIKPFSKGEKMYFRSIPNFQQFSQRTFQMANILEHIVLSFSKIMTNINFVPPETIDEYKREFDKFKDVYGQLSNKIYATFYAEERENKAKHDLKAETKRITYESRRINHDKQQALEKENHDKARDTYLANLEKYNNSIAVNNEKMNIYNDQMDQYDILIDEYEDKLKIYNDAMSKYNDQVSRHENYLKEREAWQIENENIKKRNTDKKDAATDKFSKDKSIPTYGKGQFRTPNQKEIDYYKKNYFKNFPEKEEKNPKPHPTYVQLPRTKPIEPIEPIKPTIPVVIKQKKPDPNGIDLGEFVETPFHDFKDLGPYQPSSENPTYNVAVKGPSAKDDEMEENLVKLYSDIYNNIKQLQSYEQDINTTYNYIPSQAPSRDSNNGPTKPIIELTNDLQDEEE